MLRLYVSVDKILKNSILWMVLLCVHTLAFYPVWRSLVNAWAQSEDYSHAFLIVPISIYLIWIRKEDLRAIPAEPAWLGLLIVFCAVMAYLVGTYAGIFTLNSLALVASMFGVLYGLMGWRYVRVIWFPLMFLFLMVPIPSQIYWAATTPLQLIVTKVSVFLLHQFTDIPIFRDGNVIHLPDKQLQVVAACSGMRSMISLATLSIIFGYVTLKSCVSIVILTVAALPIAIFINILRIIIMVNSDYYLQYELTSGTPHSVLGLFVFAIAIILAISLQKVLERIEK